MSVIDRLKSFNVVGAAVLTAAALIGGGVTGIVWVAGIASDASNALKYVGELKKSLEKYKESNPKHSDSDIVRALNNLRQELKNKKE